MDLKSLKNVLNIINSCCTWGIKWFKKQADDIHSEFKKTSTKD
jgi:hypothetical protein